jgi:zinc protease
MLDRTIAPPFQKVEKISVPAPGFINLNNGIPLYYINAGPQQVLKLELIFESGSWHEQKDEVAWFAANLLSEGSKKYSSTAISELFDYYGAELEIMPGRDFTFVSIYCLERFLPKLLELLIDVWTNPLYLESELEKKKKIRIQNHRVNLEKTSFLAGQAQRLLLFGANHPYGRETKIENIQAVNPQDLFEFHQITMLMPRAIIVCGMVKDENLKLLSETFQLLPTQTANSKPRFSPKSPGKELVIEKEGSSQSTIRMGKLLFQKNHPDFIKLSVVNEIFGGYFGSRLMKNIREDKGLTYGIYSALLMQAEMGYITIGSDVNRENTMLVVDEIYKEMEILRQVAVDDDELETV